MSLWLQTPMEVIDSTDFRPSSRTYWPEPMELLDFFLGFQYNSVDTVAAETNGSNGFYRLQTFEQNLFPSAYGILGFPPMFQI